MGHIPAKVEHAEDLKGQYIKNSRDQRVYKVMDVGEQGLTLFEAEGFGGQTFGDEILLTWRAFKAIYLIMVHLADIDTKPGDVH